MRLKANLLYFVCASAIYKNRRKEYRVSLRSDLQAFPCQNFLTRHLRRPKIQLMEGLPNGKSSTGSY